MKSLLFFFALAISIVHVNAQAKADTMQIGNAYYVRFHNNSGNGIVTAMITQDSILTVYDTIGAIINYPVLRWTFSITRKGVYNEVKVEGIILPLKCREWINEQPPTGWMCIENVVVLMPDGTERKLAGEKWVKL
jgi:hypothetical protein